MRVRVKLIKPIYIEGEQISEFEENNLNIEKAGLVGVRKQDDLIYIPHSNIDFIVVKGWFEIKDFPRIDTRT